MKKINLAKRIGLLPILTVLGALVMGSAHAEVQFNQLTYAGTGCPGDGKGVRVHRGSDAARVLVYMPDMDVIASGIARKVCSLAVPVRVSSRERVVIGRPAVFGGYGLPSAARLEATTEVFFAGTSGPEVKVIRAGQASKRLNFYERHGTSIAAACGQDVTVRTRTTLLVRGGSTAARGYAQVRGTAFDVRIERCDD